MTEDDAIREIAAFYGDAPVPLPDGVAPPEPRLGENGLHEHPKDQPCGEHCQVGRWLAGAVTRAAALADEMARHDSDAGLAARLAEVTTPPMTLPHDAAYWAGYCQCHEDGRDHRIELLEQAAHKAYGLVLERTRQRDVLAFEINSAVDWVKAGGPFETASASMQRAVRENAPQSARDRS